MEESHYRERPSIVPGAVLWQRSGRGGGLVLPDGCMDLLIIDDRIVIAGPDSEPYPVDDGDDRRYVGLRLAPGRLPGLLGLKAAELRNTRVPLADVLGAGPARRIGESLISADNTGRALERYAISLHAEHDPDPLVDAIVSMIGSGLSIGDVARRTGLGERRLHRLGLRHFGYRPKLLGRILRMQCALRLRADGVPSVEVAIRAGYADQAHLIRETSELAGSSFGRLAR